MTVLISWREAAFEVNIPVSLAQLPTPNFYLRTQNFEFEDFQSNLRIFIMQHRNLALITQNNINTCTLSIVNSWYCYSSVQFTLWDCIGLRSDLILEWFNGVRVLISQQNNDDFLITTTTWFHATKLIRIDSQVAFQANTSLCLQTNFNFTRLFLLASVIKYTAMLREEQYITSQNNISV